MFLDDSNRYQRFSLYESICYVHMVDQLILSGFCAFVNTFAYDGCSVDQFVYGHYIVVSGALMSAVFMFVSYHCAPKWIRRWHQISLKINLFAGGIVLMGLAVALGVSGFICELDGFNSDWSKNKIARKCHAKIYWDYQLHGPNCPESMVENYIVNGPGHILLRCFFMTLNLLLILFASVCLLATLYLLFVRMNMVSLGDATPNDLETVVVIPKPKRSRNDRDQSKEEKKEDQSDEDMKPEESEEERQNEENEKRQIEEESDPDESQMIRENPDDFEDENPPEFPSPEENGSETDHPKCSIACLELHE